MEKLFGTDGIRGVANVYPMTVEIATAVGQGAVSVLISHDMRSRVVIGKDTRLSGYMLESALVAGICSMGGFALYSVILRSLFAPTLDTATV